MPESSPSGGPSGSPHPSGAVTLSRASGEIVHEQTVRAPIPVAPTTETTVRAPFPMPPPQEQTVRAFVPSAIPGAAAHGSEPEELDELDVEPMMEGIDPKLIDVGALVSELEAHVHTTAPDADVPVSRPDQITVPETAAQIAELLEADKRAKQARGKRRRQEGPALRPEPPAVSGEVSVSEPDPDDLFGPRRDERVRAPAQDRGAAPKPRRDDPPLVSGEVAVTPASTQTPEVPTGDVFVMPMNAAGPQARMASSGSHPIITSPGPQAMMASSGSHPILLASGPQPTMASSGAHPVMTASGASPMVRRASTDAGYVIGESTGPQPGQGETGPHPIMRVRRRGSESSRDSMVLWILAGMLVVLAVGVVMVVISWAQ
jgi:hypothetical protein